MATQEHGEMLSHSEPVYYGPKCPKCGSRNTRSFGNGFRHCLEKTCRKTFNTLKACQGGK